jgi:hypothetical protein
LQSRVAVKGLPRGTAQVLPQPSAIQGTPDRSVLRLTESAGGEHREVILLHQKALRHADSFAPTIHGVA